MIGSKVSLREYILDRLRSGHNVLNFGPVNLSILTHDTPLGGFPGGEMDFFMAKSTPYIEGYDLLTRGRAVNSVLELGIFKGGSVVFFDQFFKPKRLSALDMETDRITKLDNYSRDIATADIRLHYGVDQAGRAALKAIVSSDFPEGRFHCR